MRTIETTITVTPEGEIILPAEMDLPVGTHRAVLVIDAEPLELQEPSADTMPKLHSFALNNWPADATFRREDLYGDDGR